MKLIPTTSGKLYASSVPLQMDLDSIGKFDIIWNLAKELSFLKKNELDWSKKVIIGNIEDYDIPSNIIKFKYQLLQVVKALQNNGQVLVHCMAGHGRTGMAIACIKHFLDGLSAKDSLEYAKRTCGGPETKLQKNFVKNLCK